MIKKMYNLTTNELTKLLIKPSTIVVIILIFLSAIAIPLIPKAFMNHKAQFTQGVYQAQVDAAASQLKSLNTQKPGDKAKAAFVKSQEEQAKLLIKYNINPNGWRYTEATKYLNTLIKIDTINLLKENIDPSVISANLPYGVNETDVKEYLELPSSEYASTLTKLNTEKTKIYDSIKNNNYIDHYNEVIKSGNTQLTVLEKQLDAMNSKAKKEPNNIVLKTQITKLNNSINTLKKSIKIYQYRVDNKIPFDSNNWKSATLTGIEQALPQSLAQMSTKTEFLTNPHGSTTYEQYVAKFKHDQLKANNQIQADWYSLNHNIPQTQYQSKSARDITNSFVGLYAIVAIIFMIILAGGIVSVEFSKETIKLLLIRPVSRFKVLLSKLIAVYIVGYIVLFGSMILVTISSGVLFGFSDYLSPILKVSYGVVETHNYFGSLIVVILYLSLSLLLFGALAFMLSTLTKSTAVSVSASIIIFIAGPIVTLILFGKNLIWIDKTPLPYINLPCVDVVRAFNSSDAILSNSLGGIEVAILALIFAIIAFIVFIKSDIKR